MKSPRGIAIAAVFGFLFLLAVAMGPASVKANNDDDSQVNVVVVNGTVVSDGGTGTVHVNRCDHCVQRVDNVIFIDLDWLLRHLHSHH